MKDFSVYLLDPLEDIMSKTATSSGGVAVGMGLMSEIIADDSDDSTMVTGTLVSVGADQYALEVVIVS